MTPALARAVKQTLQFWAAEARGDLPPLLVFRRSGVDIRNRFNFTIRHVPYAPRDPALAALHGLGFKIEEPLLFGRGAREGQRLLQSVNLPVPIEPIADWKARGTNLRVRDLENMETIVEDWIGARHFASVWQGDARLKFAGIDAAFEDKCVALAIGNELALGRAPPPGFHLGEATYAATALTQRVETFLDIGRDRLRRRISDDEVRAWAMSRAW
jgi:hypothetical protein